MTDCHAVPDSCVAASDGASLHGVEQLEHTASEDEMLYLSIDEIASATSRLYSLTVDVATGRRASEAGQASGRSPR